MPVADGKDQESTSEAINFWYGAKMYSEMLQGLQSKTSSSTTPSVNKPAASLGKRLTKVFTTILALNTQSLKTFFQFENAPLPAGKDPKSPDSDQYKGKRQDGYEILPQELNLNRVPGIFFQNLVNYQTYFGLKKEFVHGIQMLPLTPALQLLRGAGFVKDEHDNVLSIKDPVNCNYWPPQPCTQERDGDDYNGVTIYANAEKRGTKAWWGILLTGNKAMVPAYRTDAWNAIGTLDRTKDIDNGLTKVWMQYWTLLMPHSGGNAPPAPTPVVPPEPIGRTSWTPALNCPGSDRSKFLDCFTPFTASDPTHGAVDYQAGWTQKDELIQQLAAEPGAVWQQKRLEISFGVGKAGNRPSIRMNTAQDKAFGPGSLFVVDVEKVPVGPGTWPAYWTTAANPNPQWPHGGEIDMMEHIQGPDVFNNMLSTLHTIPGCKMSQVPGITSGGDCGIAGNAGCGVAPVSVPNGKRLNDAKGGIHVMAWTPRGDDEAIKMWWISREKADEILQQGGDHIFDDPRFWDQYTQDESTAGPYVTFPIGPNSTCPAEKYFSAQQFIIDTTFCGDWAGATFPGGSQKCVETVQDEKYGTDWGVGDKQDLSRSFVFRSIKIFTASPTRTTNAVAEALLSSPTRMSHDVAEQTKSSLYTDKVPRVLRNLGLLSGK
ncbi:unnamed protein product [Amoebophrya sp. A120]|nr:unnamed protein product [Amoebophrya sp. A120]|eukprot:GSA120T00016930001.1